MSATPELSTLRVNAVFHDVDARHADTIAAEMVSRAHQLANMPEHECDVDVNIESVAPEEHGHDDGPDDSHDGPDDGYDDSHDGHAR